MFETFKLLTEEGSDTTFAEHDAQQLRESLLVSSPLGPFLQARRKSKQYLEVKYRKWQELLS